MNLYMEFSHTSAHVRLDEAKRDLIVQHALKIRKRVGLRYGLLASDGGARVFDG